MAALPQENPAAPWHVEKKAILESWNTGIMKA
jgi:hypothetical protein